MKWFPSRSDRLLGDCRRRLPDIARAVARARGWSDAQLAERYAALRAHRRTGGAAAETLREETFALVHEAARRTLGLTAHPEQMLGALALSDGHVAEMRTGEGKTLAAAFPTAWWALEGRGVHVVTANSYLATRDAQTLAPVHTVLGLTAATVYTGQSRAAKQAAYQADITYGTSSEFAFDHLRDHMATSLDDQVQRGRAFALVDEVDSLLIDEARTPLVISGDPDPAQAALYQQFDAWAAELTRQAGPEGEGDYWADEKDRLVHLTDRGQDRAEALMRAGGVLPKGSSLYDPVQLHLLHHLDVALRAHALLQKDVHYVLRDGRVTLVDPLTGRLQPGRRWNHGLHQAVEAKERLTVAPETRPLAAIAVQHYFTGYAHLAGMTGTAATEAQEFREVYGLEVVSIPTHLPMVRRDHPDVVCVSREDKLRRVVDDAAHHHAQGRPVLIGTPSVAASDELVARLAARGLPFALLNAREHAQEAQVIARAGAPGALTVSTALAGRGTDIVLGGSLEAEYAALPADASEADRVALRADWQRRHDRVVALGGLHVIGTERQESRRVDDQLRGRAGRQGDPGSSRFYLSLEDPLLKIFATGWAQTLLSALGVSEGKIIEDPRIARHIGRVQKQVEAHHFNARKALLDYDQVVNEQRTHVLAERQQWLAEAPPLADAAELAFAVAAQDGPWDESDATDEAVARWGDLWGLDLSAVRWKALPDAASRQRAARKAFDRRWADLSVLSGRAEALRAALVDALDTHWRAHMERTALLRQGIHLRGYAQKQPLHEFRKDAHASFQRMLEDTRVQAVRAWMLAPTAE